MNPAKQTSRSASDATQALKDMLCIGKSSPPRSHSSNTSTVSMATPLRQSLDAMRVSDKRTSMTSDTLSSNSAFSEHNLKNLSPTKQNIVLEGDDKRRTFSIRSVDVDIAASKNSGSPSSTAVSCKVISEPQSRHNWPHAQYFGKLVAMHYRCSYMACSVKGKLKGSTGCVVRVTNYKTSQRAVIKGFVSDVVDLDFAHTPQAILAAVEATGSIHVYSCIPGLQDKLNVRLLVKILSPQSKLPNEYHRLKWCAYVAPPEIKEPNEDQDADDDNPAMFLALSTDNVVDIFNIEALTKLCQGREVDSEYLNGRITIKGHHSLPITDLVFSPEGSPIATSCLDGCVKFFTIDTSDSSATRCVQEWKPHDGRPVTSLFFLDDLKNVTLDAEFWKYVLTGADDNCEFKVWNCQTWTCLQVLTLSPAANVPVGFQVRPWIKVELDITANFLVLSDIKRKVLYVLNVCHNTSQPYISIVSEFLIDKPCLSLFILDVSANNSSARLSSDALKQTLTAGANDVFVDGADCVVHLRLFAVQSSDLQLMRVQVPCDPQTFDRLALSDSLTFPIGKCKASWSSDAGSLSSDAETIADPASSAAQSVSTSMESTPLSASSNFTHITPLRDNGVHPASNVESSVESKPVHKSLLTDAELYQLLGVNSPSSNQSLQRSSLELRSPAARVYNNRGTEEGVARFSPRDFMNALNLQTALAAKQVPPSASATVHNQRETKDVDVAEINAKVINNDLVDALFLTSSPGVKPGTRATEHLSPIARECARDTTDTDSGHTPKKDVFSISGTKLCVSDEYNDEGGQRQPGGSTPGKSNKDEGNTRVMGRSMLETDDVVRGDLSDRQMKYDSNSRKMSTLLAGGAANNFETIIELLKEQQCSINALRSEFRQMSEPSANNNNGQFKVNDLELNLDSKIADVVSTHFLKNNEQLHRLAEGFERCEESNQEELLSSLTGSVERCIKQKLESVVQQEISTAVLPAIAVTLESLTKKILVEFSQKITATDSLLKEGITKMLKSKSTTDAIGASVGSSIEATLHTMCRDTLVASFDHACQEMFKQVDRTFKAGLLEYAQLRNASNETDHHQDGLVNQVILAVDSLKQMEASRQPLYNELAGLATTMKAHSTQAGKQQKQIDDVIDQAVFRLSAAMKHSMRQIIHEEVGRAVKDHQSVLSDQIVSTFNSRAATPAPCAQFTMQHQREQIMNHIRRGSFNMAFQQALLASDLNLVMFVCQETNPIQIFGQAVCPLQQPILLSLIQQLSVDFSSDTRLKHKYLEEALIALDVQDESVKGHFPVVLGQLCRTVDAHLQRTDVDQNVRRSLKMLLMAAKALLGGARWS